MAAFAQGIVWNDFQIAHHHRAGPDGDLRRADSWPVYEVTVRHRQPYPVELVITTVFGNRDLRRALDAHLDVLRTYSWVAEIEHAAGDLSGGGLTLRTGTRTKKGSAGKNVSDRSRRGGEKIGRMIDVQNSSRPEYGRSRRGRKRANAPKDGPRAPPPLRALCVGPARFARPNSEM